MWVITGTRREAGSSREIDGDGSLVSRPATVPTGFDLAGHADGETCTQLPDPEPEGALRDVSGDDRGERRAAPSEPKKDTSAGLQEQVKQLQVKLAAAEQESSAWQEKCRKMAVKATNLLKILDAGAVRQVSHVNSQRYAE